MGENQEEPADNVDALNAMAGGADLEQEPVAEEVIDSALQGGDDSAAAEHIELQCLPQEQAAEAAPRQEREMVDRRGKEAMAVQYRKMMVPVMITVGAILILLGLVSVALKDAGTAISLGSSAVWFALLAVPLGIILLLGAMHFNNELKRLGQ